MAKCPLCNGSGREFVKGIHPITKMEKLDVKWCLCKKSAYISYKYPLLAMLGDVYMPLDKVDKNLVFLRNDLAKSPNLLIKGTPFWTFCHHIKSTFMKYHFMAPEPSMTVIKAYDILKKYYVEQVDGTSPQLADLNRFDLLVFTLDTKQKNDKLNTCIHEVIYNRLCACIPTWIYLPNGMSFENTREYSDELKAILKPDSKEETDRYKKVSLEEIATDSKPVENKVQRKAEDFRP